jgi:hypothetical protein
MLDLSWERTVPVMDVGMAEITEMMVCFDTSIHVTDFTAMRIGCKNSNFLVQTNRGKFLLRVTDKHGFNNERSVYDLVKDKVRVPALLFHADNGQARFFIYQFIDSISLQQRILNDNQCAHSLLMQVAKAAAILHNTPRNETSRN